MGQAPFPALENTDLADTAGFVQAEAVRDLEGREVQQCARDCSTGGQHVASEEPKESPTEETEAVVGPPTQTKSAPSPYVRLESTN